MTDDQRTSLKRSHIGFVYQFHHLLPEFSALENRPAADDRGPQRRSGEPRARIARLSGPRETREPPPGRIVGWRTAARRHRPRGRERPARAARRRADRQPRSEDRRPRLRDARRACEGDRPRRPHRHPQHGPRRPHDRRVTIRDGRWWSWGRAASGAGRAEADDLGERRVHFFDRHQRRHCALDGAAALRRRRPPRPMRGREDRARCRSRCR